MVEEIGLNPVKVCNPGHQIISYCENCNEICCEECAMGHMDHLEKLSPCSHLITDYSTKCTDTLTEAKVLLHSTEEKYGIKESSKTETESVIGKVNQAFEDLIGKIRGYQEQYRSEIVRKFVGEGGPELGGLLQIIHKLQALSVSLSGAKGQMGREMDIVGGREIEGIRVELGAQQEVIKKGVGNIGNVENVGNVDIIPPIPKLNPEGLKIRNIITYPKLKTLLRIELPWKEAPIGEPVPEETQEWNLIGPEDIEPLAHPYFWGNGSRSVRKRAMGPLYSYTAMPPLRTPFFLVRLLIQGVGEHPESMSLGVCRAGLENGQGAREAQVGEGEGASGGMPVMGGSGGRGLLRGCWVG